jgi:hypothetical protein
LLYQYTYGGFLTCRKRLGRFCTESESSCTASLSAKDKSRRYCYISICTRRVLSRFLLPYQLGYKLGSLLYQYTDGGLYCYISL